MSAISSSTSHHPSLSSLARYPLTGLALQVWQSAVQRSAGPPALRARMAAEAHDLLALGELSGRLHTRWLDLSAGLRAKVELEAPVPCLPEPTGALQVAPRAMLGLIYPPEAMLLPLPGYAYVRILQPRGVWHGNVSTDVNQALCLGSLPPGIPLREILLISYGALTMQSIQLDAFDPAGVLNPVAADWWQRNPSLIPLTREPFLRSEVSRVS